MRHRDSRIRALALAAAGLIVLAACGNPRPPPPGSPSSVAPEASQVEEAPTLQPGKQSPSPLSTPDLITGAQVIALDVQDGQTVGGAQTYEVRVGVPITYEITSDVGGTVIATGPGDEAPLSPGQTTRFEVTYNSPGSFEVQLRGGQEQTLADVSVR